MTDHSNDNHDKDKNDMQTAPRAQLFFAAVFANSFHGHTFVT